jgi:tetratricopeptide (TPR) repeat protein
MKGNYQLTAEGDGELFETTTINTELFTFGRAPQIYTQNIQVRMSPGKSLPPPAVVSVDDAAAPADARKEYQKGLKRADDNKPQQAIKHFQAAIAIYPQFYLAYVAMAEQHSKQQSYEEAIETYRKAIEMRPERAPAYTGLGVTFVKQKRYADAIPVLRHSVELDKQSSATYLFLGLAEMYVGDYAAAEQNLLTSHKMARSPMSHIYLANLYDLRSEPAKAIEHLQAFLKENPDAPNSQQVREVIEKLKKQLRGKN